MGLVPFWAKQDKGAQAAKPHVAHVIVCGNEKGGSGKSTLSFHIAVALLKAGHRIATIDLDTRQRSFTRYFENRKNCARKTGRLLDLPTHFCLDRAEGGLVIANEDKESRDLTDRIALIEKDHDFIVIDTPGSDTYLQRLAHMVADTLITPINDSFVDFDVLAKVNPDTWQVESLSQYAEAVRHARRERHKADNGFVDWIVVRNRLSSIQSRNESRLQHCVEILSAELGFRVASGVSERVIFRELFPFGLTVLDELDETGGGGKPTMSHISARNEIRQLVSSLNLKSKSGRGPESSLRTHGFSAADGPIRLHDIFV